MPDTSVEPMRLEDLEEVLAIERLSFSNPWSRHAFLYELRDNRAAQLWVARPAGAAAACRVAGYLCVWVIGDEVHVTNLAVRPEHRRQGIARRLLGTVLALYAGRGATRVALEVRPTNREARRLYESFGFRQVGRRKGYYFDTGEDALLLEADLAGLTATGPPTAGQPKATWNLRDR
jgi:ribosomal-protein-alanine N-acetyltransferase